MNIGSASGIDVGQMFQNATSGLAKDGAALQAKMDQISANGEIDQTQLLETISSVTKSIQDMLKSLAQRTG